MPYEGAGSLKVSSLKNLRAVEGFLLRAPRFALRPPNWTRIDADSIAKRISALKLPSYSRKGSIFTYSAAAVVLTLYLTDWKVVCEHIPYYRGKFARGNPRRYSIEPIR